MDLAHRVIEAAPEVIGVAVGKSADIAAIQDELTDLLHIDASAGQPTVLDSYLGPGYDVPSHAGQVALAHLAATAGILTDHIYSATALSAAIDRATRSNDGPVVFWRTGGAASAFSDVAPAAFWSPRTRRSQRLLSV